MNDVLNIYLLQGGYVFQNVGLSVCAQGYAKGYGHIFMKFSENVEVVTKNELINVGPDLDHHPDPGIFLKDSCLSVLKMLLHEWL